MGGCSSLEKQANHMNRMRTKRQNGTINSQKNSEREARKAINQLFDKYDTNKDGKLSK